MAGLTSTGFDRKRLTEIITDLRAAVKAQFGSDTNVGDDSVFGQLIVGVYADRLDELWAALEGVYNSWSIETAEGVQLDYLSSLVGITRNRATRSGAVITATGTVGSVIPSGGSFVFESTVNSNRFRSVTGVTLDPSTGITGMRVTVNTVANSTAYSVTLDGINYSITSDADATQQEILTALQALINAQPAYTATEDGTTLQILASDNEDPFTASVSANLTIGTVDAVFTAESAELGPVEATATTLTRIITNIAGVNSITNKDDADLGTNDETDAELRTRIIRSLQQGGNGTLETIKARLLDIDGVNAVTVIENSTDVTDVDGRPPHSFEAVISNNGLPETVAAIGQTLWDSKAAGIATHGTESATATDEQGGTQTVYFSEPVDKLVWAKVEYTLYDEETFPTTGDDDIKTAFVNYGEANAELDKDLIPQRFFGEIYKDVQGIDSLTVYLAVVNVGDPDPTFPADYTTSKVALNSNEIALYDVTRVAVEQV